jgi:hypothetical protein
MLNPTYYAETRTLNSESSRSFPESPLKILHVISKMDVSNEMLEESVYCTFRPFLWNLAARKPRNVFVDL